MKSMVICDPDDRYTQDDVVAYHRRIKEQIERYGKNEEVLTGWERQMCRTDLYYLLVYKLGYDFMYSITRGEGDEKTTVFRPWLFNRCREVQEDPDYHVDIWAREHFKSTIITVGKSVQDILNNPEIAICIYSYNATIAKTFVKQIRSALETPALSSLFPDIIPDNPTSGRYYKYNEHGERKTVKFQWSDECFTVKRKSMRKEPTVSGYGLVNAQPTGMHFDLLVYDDVVTPESVLTQEQNAKTTKQWQMSLNTGAGENVRVRVIGTYYAYRETYFHILNPHAEDGVMGQSAYTLRKYPCHNPDGVPVLYTEEYLQRKKSQMLGYVYDSQMECNPADTSSMRFLPEWIPERFDQQEILDHKEDYNFYILVDPANSKTKTSDKTAIIVIATGRDKRYYVCDIIADKFSPTERRDNLFITVQRWADATRKPVVFYESNSMSSDCTMIEEKQKELDYYFTITPVSTKPRLAPDKRISGVPLKYSRIYALEYLLRERRIVFMKKTVHKNWQGRMENTTETFFNDEYFTFPLGDHDDMLDALSRIADLDTGAQIFFPDPVDERIRLQRHKENQARRYSFIIRRGSYIPF